VNTLTSITIRLEDSEKQAIVDFANANDLSMAQVVRRAIKEYLAKQEDNN
jgi:predicted transcriptional regulator